MRSNPVYRRERAVRARSLRIPLIVFVFNGLLAAVALLGMYSAVEHVKASSFIQYSNFLQLYVFVVTLEFLMLIFIMPALPSGSISGERERRTLELLFTTRMPPGKIVTGKLCSAFGQLFLLIVSSFPVVVLTFVYGSMSVQDIGLLFLCYVTAALLTGGIGILFSCLMRRSTLANVCTYGVLLLLMAGTYMLNVFLYGISRTKADSMLPVAGQLRPAADSGAAVYLLLLNPGTTFIEILGSQAVGSVDGMLISSFLGNRPLNVVTGNWILVSLGVQLLLAVCLIWGAILLLKRRE